MKRLIFHVDMDAFFASIEQRDYPELRGKPVVVGGRPNGRGVVATASYEARKFGIRSAMPCKQAYKRCPQAIFVKPRFEAYQEASRKIMQVFRSLTPKIQPLSLDEAYLDLTENYLGEKEVCKLTRYIQDKIWETTNLTASIGVGPNKLVAKIGSDLNKPNGIVFVKEEDVLEFLAPLSVGKIPGVGKVMQESLNRYGIKTIAEARLWTSDKWQDRFGKMGHYIFSMIHGEDNREVESRGERKSIGAERTYANDIEFQEDAIESLKKITKEVMRRATKKKKSGHTLTVKIRYNDFQTVTRSKTTEEGFRNFDQMFTVVEKIFIKQWQEKPGKLRLLGVSMSNFEVKQDQEQLELGFL